mgnify:CR=1 FL=1
MAEEAEAAYDALDKTNVKKDIIAEANGLKDTIAGKQGNETLTQATATQAQINAATERLNQIIAGINDGTLKDPDYSGAENAIQSAKDTADDEDIPDSKEAEIEAEIAELERQLEELKETNPDSTDTEALAKIEEIKGNVQFLNVKFGYNAKNLDFPTQNVIFKKYKLNSKKIDKKYNARFSYDPSKLVIKDFSIDIKAGQKVAIVGPTGAGKTTMVNLLMKFYEINNGQIMIDGVSTSDLSRENIHDLFIMVLQDTWLFEGTIRDNLKFNKKSYSKNQSVMGLFFCYFPLLLLQLFHQHFLH